MKKYIPFFAFLIMSVQPLFCQKFDFFYPKSGLNYLEQGIVDTSNFDLIMVMGLEKSEKPAMLTDFNAGSANNWSYAFKSRDTSDHILHLFIVVCSNFQNAYNYYPISGLIDAQIMPDLSADWINSDSLFKFVAQNTDFMSYYYKNKDHLSSKTITLLNGLTEYSETPIDVWQVSAGVNSSDSAQCTYRAKTGELLGCNIIQTGVSDIIQKALSIFPNPSSDFTRIDVPFSGTYDIEISNLYGSVVKSEAITIDKTTNISISDLPSGSYIIKAICGKIVYINRLQIVR